VSESFYDRLSELDRSFLIYEGPNSPMHVGAVQIFEAAPLRGPDGHVDIERIIDYVESRLHRIPRYRQKVEAAPLDGHPIWVDDPKLNLRYHVRHSRLPHPADERTLKRSCARILEQRLDLHKPLWELWVVEGLAEDRLALVSKAHHCMIDGISGVDLMSVLLTQEPCEKAEPPPLWRPRRGPTAAEYAAGELARRLGQVAELGGALRDVLTDESGARQRLRERAEATARLLRTSASGVQLALQSTDRPAPPLRLAADEPRRDPRAAVRPRRHTQRRRARGVGGRAAPLPEGLAPHGPRFARVPGDDPSECADER
jgi:diacylglycerol O-acyltransferase